jgi:hypothetical protein
MKDWKEKKGRPNLIIQLSKKGNFISYNPTAGNGVFDIFAPFVGEENERQEETALKYDDEWYILKGDYRKQVEECNTEEEIKELFIKEHEENGSGWSTFNLK